jgi:hypothetical protein
MGAQSVGLSPTAKPVDSLLLQSIFKRLLRKGLTGIPQGGIYGATIKQLNIHIFALLFLAEISVRTPFKMGAHRS